MTQTDRTLPGPCESKLAGPLEDETEEALLLGHASELDRTFDRLENLTRLTEERPVRTPVRSNLDLAELRDMARTPAASQVAPATGRRALAVLMASLTLICVSVGLALISDRSLSVPFAGSIVCFLGAGAGAWLGCLRRR